MIEIKTINWISKSELEAEIIVSDGKFDLTCFAHPLENEIGDLLTKPLYAMGVKNIHKLDHSCLGREQQNHRFNYIIEAQLVFKSSGLVKLGDIILEIDPNLIPNDIVTNDFISFYCERIDV